VEKYEIFANTEKYRNPIALVPICKLIEEMSKIVKGNDITVGTKL